MKARIAKKVLREVEVIGAWPARWPDRTVRRARKRYWRARCRFWRGKLTRGMRWGRWDSGLSVPPEENAPF